MFRSDDLAELTDRDLDTLDDLGIDAIIDLRSAAERRAKPDRYPSSVERVFFLPASATDPAGVANDLIAGKYTASEVRDFKANNDLALLESGRVAFREVFRRAATGERVLFHCAGGRDRAGIAAAIVLLAPGVDEEMVVADYLLTNEARAPKSRHILTNHQSYGIPASSLNALVASWTADESYLRPVLDRIESRYGGIERFVTEHLRVDPETLEFARKHLVE